ncbi:MAG: hypothetical protein WCH60_19925 [Burkholderiales bacterium]
MEVPKVPNEGKRQFAMSDEEREAKIAIWSSYSDVVLTRIRMQSEEAAAFLGVSERTMQDERTAAKNAVDKDLPVDPEEIRSIPCRGSGTIWYSAFHLLEYLDRTTFKVGAGKRMPDHLKGAGVKTQKKTPADGWAQQLTVNARKFMGWMQTADAVSTWPFSIQKDGRPMDLHTAMMEDKLTGKAERLNLREFSDRLANVANAGTSSGVRQELDDGTPQAKKPESDRRDRWTKNGGPV